MIRKFGLLSLLLVATLAVHNASATISGLIYLPESSYANRPDVDNWQGWSIYDEDNFNVRIDFVVYDTAYLGFGPDGQEEEDLVNTLVDELGLTGQYIYAYQVLQHQQEEEIDYPAVGYFGLLDSDQNPIMYGTDVNSMDDGYGGKEPTSHTNAPVAWMWNGSDPNAPLEAGDHSWFLVLSSKYTPVTGNFEIKGPEQPKPVPPIPEPGTLTLLGLGATAAFIRRRKSV